MNEHQPQEEAPRLPNFFVRMAMVFFQPAALFQALAARPAWFPMLAFAATAAGASMLLLPPEVWIETMRQARPEQVEAMGSINPSILRFITAIGITGAAFGFTLVFAVVTYVVFVFFRGDEANFKQHLSILAHTAIITAVAAFFYLPFRIRSGDVELVFSVGTFMPFLTDGFLANLLQRLDIFALWGAVVAGLGFSLLDPRRRWGPTAIVAVVVMVLLPSLVLALVQTAAG